LNSLGEQPDLIEVGEVCDVERRIELVRDLLSLLGRATTRITCSPWARNRRAAAAPMPSLAPVITIT